MDRRTFLKIASLIGMSSTTMFSSLLNAKEITSIVNMKELNDNKNSDFIIDNNTGFFDIKTSKLALSTYKKLEKVNEKIGYANFNIISFDDLIAKSIEINNPFTKQEISFMEFLFNLNANELGFFGEKTVMELTNKVSDNDITYLWKYNNYMFKDSMITFEKLSKDVGSTLSLTSGIRNVPKQTTLFLRKILKTKGNVFEAASEIAPPAYSYHTICDFDVGKVGLGEKNFTSIFAKTNEYKKLSSLGYVDVRYNEDNQYGVIFEPWHIKIGNVS
jgi:hypothetical protein